MGAGIPPMGERANVPEIRQAQVAATVAKLLGRDFRSFRKDAWPALPIIGQADRRTGGK
jgi:hypothetical protein